MRYYNDVKKEGHEKMASKQLTKAQLKRIKDSEEIEQLLKNYIQALPEEVELIMEHLNGLKNDIGFLKNVDTDCTGESSGRIIQKMIEYLLG